MTSTVDLAAAFARLRHHVGELAARELVAAAWIAADNWPRTSGARPDATHRHKLAAALEAHASAAWAQARAVRDEYLRGQVRAQSHHPQGPMDDVLTLVFNGSAALEKTLDRAVADLEELRSVLRGAPAREEQSARSDNRPRGRALN